MKATDIQRALSAFAIAAESGLQVFAAAAILRHLHPPFQLTLPTLIGQIANQGPALARYLAPFFPAETIVQTLCQDDTSPKRHHLSELTNDPRQQSWWLLAPRNEEASLAILAAMIAKLRTPQGCPWDRAQTHSSLRPYLLEETHEVLAALDDGDMAALRDELGDLLLQILLHAQLAKESGAFTLHDIMERLAQKIYRRHPHVWGEAGAESPADARQTWEEIKRTEYENTSREQASERPTLAATPPGLPALLQAQRYQERAASVGFDWSTPAPVAAKVREELSEVLAAQPGSEKEAELGDLLFALVNWARWLGVNDLESALRAANLRFARRFAYIEKQLRATNRHPRTTPLGELDALWEEAKTAGL